MSESVSAVIVTFNRCDLLLRCLAAVYSQTHPPQQVIVVDNASSDGTPEALAQHGWLARDSLRYQRLATNTGGAGGFHTGMKRALETGCDWFWMMDDDGLPEADTLAALVDGALRHGLLCVAPLVISDRDPGRLAFGFGEEVRTVDQATAMGEMIGQRINPFNGTLVHRSVPERIGLVKAEMFLWGDETEYQLRMKRHFVPFGTLSSARFRHPDARGSKVAVLGGLLGSVVVKPDRLFPIFLRNQGYLDGSYYGLRRALRSVLRYTLYFLVDRRFDVSGLIRFLRYYADGFFNRWRLPEEPR